MPDRYTYRLRAVTLVPGSPPRYLRQNVTVTVHADLTDRRPLDLWEAWLQRYVQDTALSESLHGVETERDLADYLLHVAAQFWTNGPDAVTVERAGRSVTVDRVPPLR